MRRLAVPAGLAMLAMLTNLTKIVAPAADAGAQMGMGPCAQESTSEREWYDCMGQVAAKTETLVRSIHARARSDDEVPRRRILGASDGSRAYVVEEGVANRDRLQLVQHVPVWEATTGCTQRGYTEG